MSTTRKFRLYPQEARWWSFGDYGALLSVVERIRPRTALEFGPGGSTLAIAEGGATSIVTYEDDPKWAKAHDPKFAGLPIELRLYRHSDPLVIEQLDGIRFDFGFVDGPRDTGTRLAEIRFALAHCDVVACHDALSSPIAAALNAARAAGRFVAVDHYHRNPGEPHAIGIIQS